MLYGTGQEAPPKTSKKWPRNKACFQSKTLSSSRKFLARHSIKQLTRYRWWRLVGLQMWETSPTLKHGETKLQTRRGPCEKSTSEGHAPNVGNPYVRLTTVLMEMVIYEPWSTYDRGHWKLQPQPSSTMCFHGRETRDEESLLEEAQLEAEDKQHDAKRKLRNW